MARVQPLSGTRFEFLAQYVKDILARGHIKYSSSSIGAPVVMVKKGSSFRPCVVYRKLNWVLVKDAFPLPPVDNFFMRLSDAQ
jgi:hypothetical protein